MYKAIMVALADAEQDGAALAAGIRLARASAARLHLVHVRIQDSAWDQDVEKDQFLSAIDWASNELGESVSFQLIELRSGRQPPRIIARTLIRYAAAERIDLIVMGTHARTRIERSILGSVGDGLIRGSNLPILLIPLRKGRAAQESLRLRRVLVPLDGTRMAEQILPDALQLATLVEGSMALLQVIEPEPLAPYTGANAATRLGHEEFIMRSARSDVYLDRVAEQVRSQEIPVESLTLVGDRVLSVIKSAAAIEHINVIAIATRGVPAYALFRGTGIADHLIGGANCALLIRRRQTADVDQLEPALSGKMNSSHGE